MFSLHKKHIYFFAQVKIGIPFNSIFAHKKCVLNAVEPVLVGQVVAGQFGGGEEQGYLEFG